MESYSSSPVHMCNHTACLLPVLLQNLRKYSHNIFFRQYPVLLHTTCFHWNLLQMSVMPDRYFFQSLPVPVLLMQMGRSGEWHSQLQYMQNCWRFLPACKYTETLIWHILSARFLFSHSTRDFHWNLSEMHLPPHIHSWRYLWSLFLQTPLVLYKHPQNLWSPSLHIWQEHIRWFPLLSVHLQAWFPSR